MPKHRILTYVNINQVKIDMMFNALLSRGAVITGSNPWDIETHQHGILLRAEWKEAASTLAVSVTHSNWYIPREMVWNHIDSLMHDIQEMETV
jgi:hypothetical protein